MQAKTCRRLIAIAIAAAATSSAPAHAGIWQPMTTPTTQTITSIDYRGGDSLWFTTSSSIYKRAGAGWTEQLNRPGTNFNDIAFNPSGTIGIAVGDAGVLFRNTGGGWVQLPSLTTYNFGSDYCPGSGAYTLSAPVTQDLRHVRWVNDSTAFIGVERKGVLQRTVNGGQSWSEISRQANGTCRVDDWIRDVFVLPSNPNHMLFLGYSHVHLSTNGLTSTAAPRGSVCGNRLHVDANDPSRMHAGGDGLLPVRLLRERRDEFRRAVDDERQLHGQLRVRRVRDDRARRGQRGLRLEQHHAHRDVPAAGRRDARRPMTGEPSTSPARASAPWAVPTAAWS